MTTDEAYVLFSMVDFDVDKYWNTFPEDVRSTFVHSAAEGLRKKRAAEANVHSTAEGLREALSTDQVIAKAYAEAWNEWKGIEP